MEGLVTTTELTFSLFNTMKGDSSPGVVGYTVNYLRAFWDDLMALSTHALNSSLGNTLTSSLRLAIIKLLRKGQKDPTLPGNYRPISLLSIFYKLASSAITNRLKPAIESIVGPKQKAYTDPKNIGSVITNITNMMHTTITKKQSHLLMLIEF